MGERPYVVIAGNIATGKSTLAAALGPVLGVPVHLERADDNPFFVPAMAEPATWSFAAQRWFLVESLRAERAAASVGGVVDRSPEEHVDVFARRLLDLGVLARPAWAALDQLRHARGAPRPPTLLVSLVAPLDVLLERIRRRGNAADHQIGAAMLDDLNRRYAELQLNRRSRSLVIDTSVTPLDDAVGRIRDRLDLEDA
jgi:deoxyguanosine kinase